MIKICPVPPVWARVCDALRKYSDENSCHPPRAPEPLILALWAYSNDVDKMDQWRETVEWAVGNACAEIVLNISDDQFYFTAEPRSYEIGPMGGPMYLTWNYHSRDRPAKDQIEVSFAKLKGDWNSIVGPKLLGNLEPVQFTGKKFRRLLVDVLQSTAAPWGDWRALSTIEEKRRKFTVFRKAINKSIYPHEVDHVDFTVKGA
jgi:hypothetical protein